MNIFFRKYLTIILISLLIVVLALAWMFPSAGSILGIAFLLFSFAISGVMILGKHKEIYRNGQITRRVFIRNAALEITSIWLAMILAALLGRTIAEIATRNIIDALLKFFTGITIGLLVGIIVGIFASRTWSR